MIRRFERRRGHFAGSSGSGGFAGRNLRRTMYICTESLDRAAMADYDLHRLSPRDFEHLVQAVARHALGSGTITFGDGPDGGREATFDGKLDYPSTTSPWDGYCVVQAKFRARPRSPKDDARWLAEALSQDLKKFVERSSELRQPEFYIIATNVVLSPVPETGGKDVVDRVFRRFSKLLPLGDWSIWDFDELCRFLDIYGDVRRAYRELITLGDVLELGAPEPSRSLGDLLVRSVEQCDLTRLKVGQKYRQELYVARQFDQLLWESITDKSHESSKLIVVSERAGSGKTNLMCHFSERLPSEGFPSVFMLGSTYINDKYDLLRETVESLAGEGIDGKIQIVRMLGELEPIFKEDPLCILIDAVNEARDVELMKGALWELTAALRGVNCRILVTCRDIYWNFMQGGWVEAISDSSLEKNNLYYFDKQAWRVAQEAYLSAYSISGALSGEAQEKCRHPLLFRFFCEAYQGENVSMISEIRLRPLFLKYLEKKTISIARLQPDRLRGEESIEAILMKIAGLILKSRSQTIDEFELSAATGDGEHLIRDSLYVRLLDEDVMIEEVPDPSRKELCRQVRFVYEAFLEFMISQVLERKWSASSSQEILADLNGLLEPSTCMRNVIGSLTFLDEFFLRRNLNYWSAFVARGSAWQKIALGILKGADDATPLNRLQTNAVEALSKAEVLSTRLALLDLFKDRGVDHYDPEMRITTRALKDPRYQVRLCGLEILGSRFASLSAEVKFQSLRLLYDRSSAVRQYAAKRILPAAEEEPEPIRGEILKRFVCHTGSVFETLSDRQRSYAAAAMDLKVFSSARDLLVRGLDDKYSWVRSACLLRLLEHPCSHDVEKIVSMLSDEEPRVRAVALRVCHSWGIESVEATLIDHARNERDSFAMSKILAFLADVRSTNSVSLFKKHLQSQDYWVSLHSGRGLLACEGTNCIERLVDAMRTEAFSQWPSAWTVRRAIGGVKEFERVSGAESRGSSRRARAISFLAGVFAPDSLVERRHYSEPSLKTRHLRWVENALRSSRGGLRESFLRGLCYSPYTKRHLSLTFPELFNRLQDICRSGHNLEPILAARVLASTGHVVPDPAIERVLGSDQPSHRKHLLIGVVQNLKKRSGDAWSESGFGYGGSDWGEQPVHEWLRSAMSALVAMSLEEHELREYAVMGIDSLQRLGWCPPTASALEVRLRDEDPEMHKTLYSSMLGHMSLHAGDVQESILDLAFTKFGDTAKALQWMMGAGKVVSTEMVEAALRSNESAISRIGLSLSIEKGEAFVRRHERRIIELSKSSRARLRAESCAALAVVDNDVSWERLLDLCLDNDARVRSSAFSALGVCGRKPSVALLLVGIEDPEEQVRAAALELLADDRSHEALNGIVGRLDDERYQVRRTAFRVLGTIDRGLAMEKTDWLNLSASKILDRFVDFEMDARERVEICRSILNSGGKFHSVASCKVLYGGRMRGGVDAESETSFFTEGWAERVDGGSLLRYIYCGKLVAAGLHGDLLAAAHSRCLADSITEEDLVRSGLEDLVDRFVTVAHGGFYPQDQVGALMDSLVVLMDEDIHAQAFYMGLLDLLCDFDWDKTSLDPFEVERYKRDLCMSRIRRGNGLDRCLVQLVPNCFWTQRNAGVPEVMERIPEGAFSISISRNLRFWSSLRGSPEGLGFLLISPRAGGENPWADIADLGELTAKSEFVIAEYGALGTCSQILERIGERWFQVSSTSVAQSASCSSEWGRAVCVRRSSMGK